MANATALKVIEIPNKSTASAADTIIEAAITATSLTATQGAVKNSVRLADGRTLIILLY